MPEKKNIKINRERFEIIKSYANNHTIVETARLFDISESTVSRIRSAFDYNAYVELVKKIAEKTYARRERQKAQVTQKTTLSSPFTDNYAPTTVSTPATDFMQSLSPTVPANPYREKGSYLSKNSKIRGFTNEQFAELLELAPSCKSMRQLLKAWGKMGDYAVYSRFQVNPEQKARLLEAMGIKEQPKPRAYNNGRKAQPTQVTPEQFFKACELATQGYPKKKLFEEIGMTREKFYKYLREKPEQRAVFEAKLAEGEPIRKENNLKQLAEARAKGRAMGKVNKPNKPNITIPKETVQIRTQEILEKMPKEPGMFTTYTVDETVVAPVKAEIASRPEVVDKEIKQDVKIIHAKGEAFEDRCLGIAAIIFALAFSIVSAAVLLHLFQVIMY